MSNLYSVSLNLTNKKATVFGGGKVAERKIKTLLETGAKINLISPKTTNYLEDLFYKKRICWIKDVYSPTYIKESFLVIAATNDRIINSTISKHCQEQNILVNVVDSLEDSSFIVNASVKRGDLNIAISTSGKSPALAKQIRKEIQEIYGPEYGQLIDFLGEIRIIIKNKINSPEKRQQFYYKVISPEIIDLLKKNRIEEARERVVSWLSYY